MAKKNNSLDDFLNKVVGQSISKSKNNTTKKTTNKKTTNSRKSNNSYVSSAKSVTKTVKNVKSYTSDSKAGSKRLTSDMAESVLDSVTKKTTKSSVNSLTKKVVTYVILWIALLVTIPFSPSIEKFVNNDVLNFASKGEFAVHFIDVGQGDCTLIQLPDNKIVMIDTGPAKSKTKLFDYLSNFEFTTIDYLILTHPDEDHIGNAVSIYEKYNVLRTYSPTASSTYMESNSLNTEGYNIVSSNVWSNTTKAMREEVGSEIIYNFKEVVIKDETNKYDYSLSFFTPLKVKQSSNNDYSPFILVTLPGAKFMFTGDASVTKEAEFLNEYAPLVESNYFDVDVYQVGHHGSSTSSSMDFLNAIKAEKAVISCGAGNTYGHPTEDALERLTISGCDIIRTDLIGNVVMTKDDTYSGSDIQSKSYSKFSTNFYLEWKYVIIIGGVLLIVLCFILFKKKKELEK